MSSALPTAEAWLTTILSPEQVIQPIDRHLPSQHHKDNVSQLEFVFQALHTNIPFGGLALLFKRVHINRPMLSTWWQKAQRDPAC
jgi:hypothetical protein